MQIESRAISLELRRYSLVNGKFNLEHAKMQTLSPRFKMLFARLQASYRRFVLARLALH
jgi:hypothetical protein